MYEISDGNFTFQAKAASSAKDYMVIIPIANKLGISIIMGGVETIFIIDDLFEVISDNKDSLNNFIKTVKSKKREIAKAIFEDLFK